MESDTVTQRIPNTWAFWSDDYHADRCVVCGREAGGRSSVSVLVEDNTTMAKDGGQYLPVGKRCARMVPSAFLSK